MTIGDAPRVELTDRQRAVLRLLCAGATDRQIAAHIEASGRTVQREIARVRAVLGAPTRAAMIAATVRAGELDAARHG
ncbi:LuxR C-terminal-related transcriptional regulator [Micromonospora pattaloongensis]|nr:LuxR C-terminal-related transcriptional regulator [Micromonospora pattaloongensis]